MYRGGRRASCIWHRRAGKDDFCLHWAALSNHRHPANYWHMLPEYGQGRKAIWKAVNPHTGKRRIDEAFPHWMRKRTSEQDMYIEFWNGGSWQVVGSDRYDSAVGSSPYGIVFSEWALSNPSAWAILAPILIENGGWAIFITTSRGRNHAYTLHQMAMRNPDWFAETLTVNDTIKRGGKITPEMVEQQRVEYTGIYGQEAADSLIEQEYYCSFEAAVLGAFYGKLMTAAEQEGRISAVAVNPDLPVQKAWDIGVDDPMAIWCFQVYPGRIDIVDYYENHGLGFDHYRDWLFDRGYRGADWVPHDAKVHEPGAPGARTRIETMFSLGLKPQLVPNEALMDGINAARLTIPLSYFDEKRCARGIECLRQYKTEWDENAHTFRKTPAHDWSSHGADAWRYLSVAWRQAWAAPPEPPKENKPLNQLTYNELLEIDEANHAGASERI